MNKTVRNERRKFTASWLNAIATALVAAGVFALWRRNLWFWVESRRSSLGAYQFRCLPCGKRGITSSGKAASRRTGGMTQFQAIAILMPVFAFVILVVLARWTQYQDRAPGDNPDQSKPAQRDR
jgi:hypothetical protein